MGSVRVEASNTSAPCRTVATTPSVSRGMNSRAMRTARAIATSGLTALASPWPAAEANSARGSTGRGRKPSPWAVTAPPKRPCVAIVTSCPAERGRVPNPV